MLSTCGAWPKQHSEVKCKSNWGLLHNKHRTPAARHTKIPVNAIEVYQSEELTEWVQNSQHSLDTTCTLFTTLCNFEDWTMAQLRTLTKSVSCDHVSSFDENSVRRVRWSMDLEEIHYFTPPKPRRKSITERLREFKDKANDFADRTFRQNGHYRCNSRFESIFRRGYSSDNEIDLNRQWDELFELYKERVMQNN